MILLKKVIGLMSVLFFGAACNDAKIKGEKTQPVMLFSQHLPYFNADYIKIENKGALTEYQQKPLQAVLFGLYANGDTSFTIRFENGKEHGEATSYYLGAKIKDKRFFVNGWKQGQHKGWYENGKLAYAYAFKDDEFNGTVKEWTPLGILFREMNYVNGHEEGMQTIRYADGKIKSNYHIKNGNRYGLLGTKNCINVSDSIFH